MIVAIARLEPLWATGGARAHALFACGDAGVWAGIPGGSGGAEEAAPSTCQTGRAHRHRVAMQSTF